LLALCRAPLDSVSLRRKLRAELLRALPFDAYCVNTADPESLVVTSSIGDGLAPAEARRLFELEEQGDDFNRLSQLASGPEHVASISQATCNRPELSQRMRELFLPRGWNDELRAGLVVDGHCWGYLHLFRAARAFTVDEVALVATAVPLLASALRRACLRGASAAVPSSPPGVALFDRNGALAGENAATHSWLEHFRGDVGGATPHVLPALAARLDSPPGRAAARYRSPRGGWLAVHASRLQGGSSAVVLTAAQPSEVASLVLLAHGLSAREQEVARLLLQGLSNPAIAQVLGIALFTVKDHVKAILSKTGAAGRTGLAARFSD
jgi:DNA-binding CsgD family transcriptional regulator